MKQVYLSSLIFSQENGKDGKIIEVSLISVILQNFVTKQVLFGSFMSKENLIETMETGYVILFSRSRNKRWFKGETSGDKLELISIKVNCNCDQLLIEAKPVSGVCHKKNDDGNSYPTCFFRELKLSK